MDDLERTVYFRADEKTATSNNAKITIFDGASDPIQIDLASFGKSIITFGRDAANDIVIQSKFVSRKHGHFRITSSGKVVIEDDGSKNGLIYKSVNIRSRELEDNDAIRIDESAQTSSGVLIVFSCKSAGETWHTIPTEGKTMFTIGRDKVCDICLNHVGVSRVHAKITYSGGRYYISDNASTNGTWINGVRVTGSRELNEKDIILITNSKIIFSSGKISYCTFNQGIALKAGNISKVVDKGKKTICNNVTLDIKPCELVAIVGGSGAGKSTVMNCISGYSVPTRGDVSVNGVDLYSNLDMFRNIIGYVPQQDIVYENLTVHDMLSYTANLRLPKDMSKAEKKTVIAKVIETVELTNHKDTMIKRLSGGQKKRASIAVELISDPNLFFLDEPCSGLDPGTERNLMNTLKNMAHSGKTVIFVTHSTLNLAMCDKIAFMGTGGRLCFYGTYNEALSFFGVDDIVDVYNMIYNEAEMWQRKYNSSSSHMPGVSGTSSKPPKTGHKASMISQMIVLAKRHLHIMINDKTRLLMLLLQPPLLALLISVVADGNQFEYESITKSLLFALSCSAFWIGMLNSIQEVCKERNILKREYMTGLRIDSYIISKLFVMGLVCAVQSVLLTTVFTKTVGCPTNGVVIDSAYIELLGITFLTAFAASATGLLVSSLVKNADRAMTIAPILLMPQLLFSGLIFKLSGAAEAISYFVTCRFSVEAYGTTANLNSLISAEQVFFEEAGFPYDASAEEINTMYEYTVEHFATSAAALCVFVVVCAVLAAIVLKNIKNENK